jgi:hypothetical protein
VSINHTISKSGHQQQRDEAKTQLLEICMRGTIDKRSAEILERRESRRKDDRGNNSGQKVINEQQTAARGIARKTKA